MSSSVPKRCVVLLGASCLLVIGILAVVARLGTSQLLAIISTRSTTWQLAPTRRFRMTPTRDSQEGFQSVVAPTASPDKVPSERAPQPQPSRQRKAGGGCSTSSWLANLSSSSAQQFGRHKLTSEDQEAAQSDEQYLKRFLDSCRVLCNADPRANGAPVATMYSTPQEACGHRGGELVVLNGVKMHHRASKTILSVPPCNGREDHKWADAIYSYALGDSHLESREDIGSLTCDLTIEEDTILIINPRWEFFGGVFHNLEDVFALMQTADVLGREPRDFRVLLVYTKGDGSIITLVQPPDQLDTPLPFDAGFKAKGAPYPSQYPKKLVPQLVDIYSKVAASAMDGDNRKFLITPLPSNLPRSATVCFKGEVVLPMRTCLGSVLTRTWSSLPQVHRLNHLAMRYSKHIAEDIYHCYIDKNRKMRVQIVSRHSNSGRNMHDKDQKDLVAGLQAEFPNAVIDDTDFNTLTMQEQICCTRKTDLMIGVHGSGLTHMIYMPPGSSVLEITPYPVPFSGFSYANYPRNLARWTNHHHHMVRIYHESYYVRFDIKAVVKKAAAILRDR